MANEIIPISQRRDEIVKKISEHQDAISALEIELAELDSFERTIARLVSLNQPKPNMPQVPLPQELSKPRGKPVGTPTVTEMVLKVLGDFQMGGVEGATITDIWVAISAQWWPSVTSSDISPVVWRMAKRGQIIRGDDGYRLPFVKKARCAVIDFPRGREAN